MSGGRPHPWQAFLDARARCLKWLRDERKQGPDETCRTMRMDPMQVLLILQHVDEMDRRDAGKEEKTMTTSDKIDKKATPTESEAAAEFVPGLYRHYKGGLYTALAIVTHHETRRPMVLYVSLHYGAVQVRPLVGWAGDADGWLDEILVASPTRECESAMMTVARFEYVGSLPSDVLVGVRAATHIGASSAR